MENWKKRIFVAFVMIVISFSGCGSLATDVLEKSGLVKPVNSEAHPEATVGLPSLRSTATEDSSHYSFDRESTGQYYFENSYSVRTDAFNVMNNVMSNMSSTVNINSILLRIDDGSTIVLSGHPVSGRINTFRFPVSTEITNQLLNCNSFSLQIVGQGIHVAHQEPVDVRDTRAVKRFINHWNNGSGSRQSAAIASPAESASPQESTAGAGTSTAPSRENIVFTTSERRVDPTLPVPADVRVTAVYPRGIRITWTEVEGASYYILYRATSPSGEFSHVASTTSSFHTNTARLNASTTYYYKVSAVTGNGTESEQSSHVSTTTSR